MGAGRTPHRLRGVSAPVVAATIDPKKQGVARSQNTAEIRVDRIVRDANQPREEFDPEGLASLAESLKTRGQLQPIRVRWDEGRGVYVIVCGERRWRAAALAGLETLTCVIHEGEIDVLAIQLIENALREDLKPIEQATGRSGPSSRPTTGTPGGSPPNSRSPGRRSRECSPCSAFPKPFRIRWSRGP